MPRTPDTVLAAALSRARQAARDDIVRSQDLSRSDREFLVSRKWLREIIRAAYYGNFHTLPHVAVLVSLKEEASRGKKHRGVVKGEMGHDEAMMSASMPILMMVLEAEDLGVDSCILSLDEKRLGRLLNSGHRRTPIAVGLGYLDKNSKSAGMMHKRKPLAEIVKKERL